MIEINDESAGFSIFGIAVGMKESTAKQILYWNGFRKSEYDNSYITGKANWNYIIKYTVDENSCITNIEMGPYHEWTY